MESEIVKDELIYTGKVCRVHKIGLKMDTGDVVPRDLIEFGNAVVMVPVLADGSVVIIRNERFVVGEELYEFPAGKIDGDEASQACASRELIEETGYTAGRLEKLGGFYTCPGAITEYIHVFAATELTAGSQMLEEYERIEVELVSPGRIDDMIRSGELHDAKSISAWAMWRLKEQ